MAEGSQQITETLQAGEGEGSHQRQSQCPLSCHSPGQIKSRRLKS